MSGSRKNSRTRNTSGRVVHRVEFPMPAPRRKQPRVQDGVVGPPGQAAPPGQAPAPAGIASLEDLARLEEQLLARAEARLASSAPKQSADKRRVEQLERRLRKLSGQLDERDRILRKLISRTQDDPGIASLTEVTGLDEGDEQFEAKKEMMSSIFQANLTLRKQVDGS